MSYKIFFKRYGEWFMYMCLENTLRKIYSLCHRASQRGGSGQSPQGYEKTPQTSIESEH